MTDHKSPGVVEIERGLRRLERLRHALMLARGLAAWLCVMIPAAAGLCLLDWYSHMPLPVRWLTTVGLVALGWFLVLRLVRPVVRDRRKIDDTALSVERRFPELADRVISAVQLERHRGDWGHGSPELVAATQEQAVEWSRRLRFVKAQPVAVPLVLAAVGLLTVALAAWAAVTFPGIVSVWAGRCFWNLEYPNKTRIEDYPANMFVPRGESAVITVTAAGILPDRGAIQVRTANSGLAAIDLLRSDKPGRRNQYAARIEQVVEPLAFRILLGDAPAAEGRIDVTDRPEVSDIRLDMTYPEYTGLRPESFLSGHVRAVPGTRVRLTVRPSKPLASARLAFDDGREEAMTKEPPAASAESWTAGFPVSTNGGYCVLLKDTARFANAAPVHYQIAAAADGPPKAQIVRPGAEVLATPVSIIRIEYRITDDFGLRRGRLMFRVNEEKDFRAIPLPLPGLTSTQLDAEVPAPGARRAEQVLSWDISPLTLKVGDIITYHLEADDHAPRAKPTPGLSPDREIRIVDEATVRKQLQDELEAAAQQIERLYTLERESQDRIRQLQKDVGPNGAPAPKKDR